MALITPAFAQRTTAPAVSIRSPAHVIPAIPNADVQLLTPPAALARLDQLKAALATQGIDNLEALDNLNFSGTVAAQQGLSHASVLTNWPAGSHIVPVPAHDPTVNTHRVPVTPPPTARTIAPSQPILPTGTSGSAARTDDTLPVDTAYFVGNQINFADNTAITIQPNVRFLVVIANKITVGLNVTLGYASVPPISPPGVPPKPSAVPIKPITPTQGTGVNGGSGAAGSSPPQIQTPPDAPQVELWTLDLNRIPVVTLKGQQGYAGVQGGAGGDGGPGGDGGSSHTHNGLCEYGPGSGGNGGQGGPGAKGGQGGSGGNGGAWALYASSNVITNLIPGQIDTTGGATGPGGLGGMGGSGGAGGSHGGSSGTCNLQNWSSRTNGSTGTSGVHGDMGQPGGSVGGTVANPQQQIAINATDFSEKLNSPAIDHVAPQYPQTVFVGDTITIYGMHFLASDVVKVAGAPVLAATYVSDTVVQAVVPYVWGGLQQVTIERSDGSHISNAGTLWIQPKIFSVSPTDRLKPGSTVQVSGTGFTPTMNVRINHLGIVTVTAPNGQYLSFTMRRPPSIPHDTANAAGEPAVLSVASTSWIAESPTVPIVIATYQMLVIGDSVAWGEGLQVGNKFHTLLENRVKVLHPGIEVYKTVAAHTGAILGWPPNTSIGSALNGDIPTDDPTILSQADMLATQTGHQFVDLIVLTACANDVGFHTFLDPQADVASISLPVHLHCRDDLEQFLVHLGQNFPAATVIIGGYYQGISQESGAYVTDLVGTMYGIENHNPRPADLSAGQKTQVSANAAYFASEANSSIAIAVAYANSHFTTTRFHFADPGFGPTHAANASDAWVFGLSGGILPGPTDSPASLSARESACLAVYLTTNSESYQFCRLASTGHPNETGAQVYYNAMAPSL